jgi:hypothetical protein
MSELPTGAPRPALKVSTVPYVILGRTRFGHIYAYRTRFPKTPNCASCDTLLVGPQAADAVTVVRPISAKVARQTSYCASCVDD